MRCWLKCVLFVLGSIARGTVVSDVEFLARRVLRSLLKVIKQRYDELFEAVSHEDRNVGTGGDSIGLRFRLKSRLELCDLLRSQHSFGNGWMMKDDLIRCAHWMLRL